MHLILTAKMMRIMRHRMGKQFYCLEILSMKARWEMAGQTLLSWKLSVVSLMSIIFFSTPNQDWHHAGWTLLSCATGFFFFVFSLFKLWIYNLGNFIYKINNHINHHHHHHNHIKWVKPQNHINTQNKNSILLKEKRKGK